jgi:two-component system response regulator HydG
MSIDTASVPGEDLRDLGFDIPTMVTGLLVIWASEEAARVGEVFIFESFTHWFSVGRGPDSPGGHRRAVPVRQRAGEHMFMNPLATTTTSADQMLVKAAGMGLELQNIGRHPMYVNGRQVARATVEVGDLVHLFGQFLFLCVSRPLPMPQLRHTRARFIGPFGEANPFDMVAESQQGWALIEWCAFAAKDDNHVLLHGETGSGKEAAAKMIHGMGSDPDAPFVAISAANLADSLLEDQLYGHAEDYPQKGMKALKGAFTEADGGTLFIDEIGQMSKKAQAALLRVLDGGEYKVLGEEGTRRSKFRLIGAMNGDENLLLMKDLLKRMVLRHVLPTLGQRRDDIPLIVRHLLRKSHAKKPELTKHLLRKQVDGSEEVVPPVGFIAELIKRPVLDGNVRDVMAAVSQMLFETTPAQGGGEVRVRQESDPGEGDEIDDARGNKLTKAEIEWALGKNAGNVSAAARALGVTRQTLYRAMERVGVRGRGG